MSDRDPAALLLAAEGGDAAAMLALGLAHKHGKGVAKDREVAVSYFTKAVRAPNPPPAAFFHLAASYFKGQGVAKNVDAAVQLYRVAAESGHAEAQLFLGLCLQGGKGVPAEPAEAFSWLQRAALGGLPQAATQVGYALEHGLGVAMDKAAAVGYYSKGAEAGDAGAMFNLAGCYLEGRGVEVDSECGLAWLKKARDAGDPDADRLIQQLTPPAVPAVPRPTIAVPPALPPVDPAAAGDANVVVSPASESWQSKFYRLRAVWYKARGKDDPVAEAAALAAWNAHKALRPEGELAIDDTTPAARMAAAMESRPAASVAAPRVAAAAVVKPAAPPKATPAAAPVPAKKGAVPPPPPPKLKSKSEGDSAVNKKLAEWVEWEKTYDKLRAKFNLAEDSENEAELEEYKKTRPPGFVWRAQSNPLARASAVKLLAREAPSSAAAAKQTGTSASKAGKPAPMVQKRATESVRAAPKSASESTVGAGKRKREEPVAARSARAPKQQPSKPNKMCQVSGCGKHSSYGIRGGKPQYCKPHAPEGMVYVKCPLSQQADAPPVDAPRRLRAPPPVASKPKPVTKAAPSTFASLAAELEKERAKVAKLEREREAAESAPQQMAKLREEMAALRSELAKVAKAVVK